MFWQTEFCFIRDTWVCVQSNSGFKLGGHVAPCETTVQLHIGKHTAYKADVGLPKYGVGNEARIVKWNRNWGIDDRERGGLRS